MIDGSWTSDETQPVGDGGLGRPLGAPSSKLTPVPGLVLANRYELRSHIASGGMAQVWRATDLTLGRSVAIKILHSHMTVDANFVARFRREAVSGAQLRHPSIVAVYDTISEPGVEAIVMELIEGRTLREVLDRSRVLPPATVVNIGIQVAAALNEAHRIGLVHRDIKPANIMISDDQRVMVTDFGIAKGAADADLTAVGSLLGTVKYLSPEQVRGEDVDPRSDLYALGIVLFEAVTGRVPFSASTDAATALARLSQAPPAARDLRPDVPGELSEVIRRAMAVERVDRYDRAIGLKAALSAVDLRETRGGPTDWGPGIPYAPDPAPQGFAQAIAPTVPAATTPMAAPGHHQDPHGGYAAGMNPNPVPAQPISGSVPPALVARDGTAVMPDGIVREAKSRAASSDRRRRRGRGGRRKADVTAPPPAPQAVPGPGVPATKSRRGLWTSKALVVLIVAGALAVLGALVASTFSDPETVEEASTSYNPNSGFTITAASPIDPLWNGNERNDLIDYSIDRDVTTRWQTDTYKRAGLGGLKAGLGVVFTIDGVRELNRMELLTDNSGWAGEIYVMNEGFEPSSVGVDPQFNPADYGTLVATVSDGGALTRETLRGASDKVLLWITETGTAPDDNLGQVHRFELYEVTVS